MCKKIIFNFLIFLNILIITNKPLIAAEENTYFNWTPNLNFSYENSDIEISNVTTPNLELERQSTLNINWHAQQAENLFIAYNYCQGQEDGRSYGAPRRNVITSSFGVVIESKGKNKVIEFPIDKIFLDGWSVEDTRMPELLKSENISLKSKFFSLDSLISQDFTIEKVNRIFGINFFNIRNNRITKEFKKTQCHSEKTLLVYLLKNFKSMANFMASNLMIKQRGASNLKIKDFIINIASLRDVCHECYHVFRDSTLKNRLVNHFKEILNETGFNISDNVNLIVFASGINAYGAKGDISYTRSNFIKPEQEERSSIIELPKGGEVLYHVDSPYHVEMVPQMFHSWQLQ